VNKISHTKILLTGTFVSFFCGILLCFNSCTAPKAPEGKILVEFWDFPRLPAVNKWMEEKLAEFQELNPDVHIEYTRLSWGKGGERMDIAVFAGRPPDLAGAVLALKYVQADLIMPIDQYLEEEIPGMPGTTWKEDIHPYILQSVQWKGKTWAFPWYKEGFVMLLNKDRFEQQNVPLPDNGQWTWEEFVEKMHQVTVDQDQNGKMEVYGVGYSTGKEKWEAYSFLFAEGMELLSKDGRTCLIDSEETRRGIERLLALEYTEKVALPGAGGIMDDATWTAFSSPDRRLATTCQGLWATNAVAIQNQRLEEARENNPQDKFLPDPLNVSLALFPIMPGKEQVMASYGVGSYMVFKRAGGDQKRTEAAARLARFLTLEQGQEINRKAGLFPSRISKKNVLADDPRFKDILEYIPDAISPPIHPAWPRMDQTVGEQLQLGLLKKISVDEAVTEMGRGCQDILDAFWSVEDKVGGSSE
jgi:multiple sugar transport system substrate-binding protein